MIASADGLSSRQTLAFWGLILAYCLLMGQLGLVSVHYFYDAVGIRDAGTILPHLTWQRHGQFSLLYVLAMHMEGPLQISFLNLYCPLVGDLLPLEPWLLHLPQSLLAAGDAVYIFLICRRLWGDRLACLAALAYVLMPWWGHGVRRPWFFITFACFFEAATLYHCLRLIQEPQRRRHRLASALALTLYLAAGMDWPSFLPSLFIFLLVGGGLRPCCATPTCCCPWVSSWSITPGSRFFSTDWGSTNGSSPCWPIPSSRSFCSPTG